MKTYLNLTFLIFLLSSCEFVDVVPLINKNYSIKASEEEKIEYSQEINLKYGEDELQNYDLYLPKNVEKAVPVIVLFHGGGWSEGDKGFINPMVDYLRQKNVKCAIVNTNYRLTFKKGITYREQLEDIDILLKKLKKEAKELNIVPEFFLMGISAGSHLAMLYAYSEDKQNLVEGVGGITTPTDLTSTEIRKGRMNSDIEKLIGKTFEESPEEYEKASPIFQLKRSVPPTIVFFGGKDDVVPKEQGVAFNEKLKKLNIKSEYYLFENQTHNWLALNETLDKMIDFVDEVL